MKTLLLFVLLSVSANASVVYIDSEAANAINSSAHPTVDLSGTLHPNPLWAAPLPGSVWISYGSTGDYDDPGYFSPANGTVVTFTAQFFLTGPITSASLTVMADDSTSVELNGHMLATANLSPGPICARGPIGCLASTEEVFDFGELDPYLVDGANSLSFGVVQVGGYSFGLDFAGSVDPGETPEPGAMAFIAAGLAVLAALRWRNNRPGWHHLVI